jgi:trigger factor
LQDLTVAFKEKNLKEEIDKLAEELKKEVTIPGFRKGKVPVDIIKTRFGGQLRAESIQKLIQDKMIDIIKEYEPFIYGPPVVKNLNEDNEEVRLEVELDVPPKIDLDLSDIKIKGEDKEEIDVNQELEKLREINSELKSVNREIKKGDIVFIDIKKGEENVNNYSWEIRDDEFSQALLGLSTGEKKEIETELPEAFPVEKSKEDKYPVTVNIVEVKEKNKPVLDDEFAKDLGFSSLSELKKSLKDNIIEEERKKSQKETLADKILAKVLNEAGDFSVSPTLVKMIGSESLNDKEAEKNAKKTALLDAIALKERISIAEEELDKWLDRLAESDEGEFENLDEETALRFIKQLILREKALDFLVDKARKED